MPEDDPNDNLPAFIEEVKDRQRNVQWHDTLRNNVSFNRFMWHGSTEAPTVQRIGLLIFGLCFLGFGLATAVSTLRDSQDTFSLILGLPLGYLGFRFIRNAFR